MNFMHRALDLAEQVVGSLAPRPSVGAVIVAADGTTILGQGATEPKPGPHAEAVAIRSATKTDPNAARNATIYCTLEPHQNRATTTPCTQAIINAGIKRVVCPTTDPNPLVNGRGFQHLKSAGIQIINKVDKSSQRRANELIEGFTKHTKTGLPLVTVKWAMSLDGKIATRQRDSKWITGNAARAHAHTLRYRSDAIITGIGTILADNPRLTARNPQTGKRNRNRPYLRVVIDSNAKMLPNAAILEESGEILQAVARNTTSLPLPTGEMPHTAPVSPASGETSQEQRGRLQTIAFPTNDNKSVDITAVIRHLGERGCHNILVEAGEKLTGTLFDLKLVDKVVAYMNTNKIIGGTAALSPIGGEGPTMMSETTQIRAARIEHLGDDIAIIGYVNYSEEMNRCSAA